MNNQKEAIRFRCEQMGATTPLQLNWLFDGKLYRMTCQGLNSMETSRLSEQETKKKN